MNFDQSEKVKFLIEKLNNFMDRHIYPIEKEVLAFYANQENLWKVWPGMEGLKELAKRESLWNLFLPLEYGSIGGELTNLEYAPLAEIMGRVDWASEVFNCSPPDTGNIEMLAKFGTDEQKRVWLTPLLEGTVRSAYVMTEPQVASSDATNLEMSIVRDGEHYVLNGRKWWASGPMDPRCKVYFVMGKTSFDAPRHQQHSVIIVPSDTKGITIVRPLTVFGDYRSPGGEVEMVFENVRVPVENILLGEGRGFEIAQGRLGPGRIHHCMRSIGQAQRSLELMTVRSTQRATFGRKLSDHGSIREDIAKSYFEIEMARLLILKAADQMDKVGNKGARDLIAAIKCVAPVVAQQVCDRAVQIFGGMGVSSDTPVANFMLINRFVRITDGPDQVHLSQLGKLKIKEYAEEYMSMT